MIRDNFGLLRFALCLAQKPIRYKTKINCDLVTRVFPRFRRLLVFVFLVLNSHWFLVIFPLFLLAVVISTVLDTQSKSALTYGKK